MSTDRPVVHVDYFADLACPWCYVSWVALKRAAHDRRDRLSITVTWRPYMLSTDIPKDGLDRTEYFAQRLAPERIKTTDQAVRRAGEAAGAPFHAEWPARVPNTLDAHRLVQWASAQGAAEGVIDQLFRLHWGEARDIGDRKVLIEAAEAAGLDPKEMAAKLVSDADRAAVLEAHAAAKRVAGGVPVALFNRKKPLLGAQPIEVYGYTLEDAAGLTPPA